jgi:hypothetical protein
MSEYRGTLRDAVAQLDADLMTFDLVQERLVEAWGYLLRMPDREAGFQRIKAMWPDVRRHNAFGDYGDMDVDAKPKLPGLRTAEVDQMEEALGWVEWVSERDRKLIGLVLGQLQRLAHPEWDAVARRIVPSPTADACRKRYGRALHRICTRLESRRKA